MEEILKKVLSEGVLNEEAVSKIQEAFDARIEDAREEVRKDLAEQYSRDKERIVAAMELMVEERLKEEFAEFEQDKKEARKQAVAAAKKIAESEKYVNTQLKKRVKAMAVVLENALEKEMSEFADDRRAQRKATNAAIKEAKTQTLRNKKLFIKKGAAILEQVVDGVLTKKMREFHKDIEQSRRNDFGRRVMEAFGAEYETFFLNKNDYAKKLKRKVTALEAKVKMERRKADRLQESVTRRVKEDRKVSSRKKLTGIKEELLSTISDRQARGHMAALLEGKKSERELRSAFRKYLPAVTEASVAPSRRRGKKGLFESGPKRKGKSLALRTGNKASMVFEEQQDDYSKDPDLLKIQKMAGIAPK